MLNHVVCFMHTQYKPMLGERPSASGPCWAALGIFFNPCPTGDLLGGALSTVRAQCNYLDV